MSGVQTSLTIRRERWVADRWRVMLRVSGVSFAIGAECLTREEAEDVRAEFWKCLEKLGVSSAAGPDVDSGAGGLCEVCSTWCEIEHTHRLLTGHHENCPHSPKAIDAALGLIAELALGMERWGADEDGIHDEAWEPYRRAKALQGVFVQEGCE